MYFLFNKKYLHSVMKSYAILFYAFIFMFTKKKKKKKKTRDHYLKQRGVNFFFFQDVFPLLLICS